MDSPYLNTAEAANYMRKAKQTVIAWRCRGIGPKYIKDGRSVLYRKDALDSYLSNREIDPSTAKERTQ